MLRQVNYVVNSTLILIFWRAIFARLLHIKFSGLTPIIIFIRCSSLWLNVIVISIRDTSRLYTRSNKVWWYLEILSIRRQKNDFFISKNYFLNVMRNITNKWNSSTRTKFSNPFEIKVGKRENHEPCIMNSGEVYRNIFILTTLFE